MRARAVVLAGRPAGPLAAALGGTHEALIELAGRPMLAWVLEALRAAPSVCEVRVVGQSCLEDVVAAAGCRRVEAGPSLVQNMRLGAGGWPANQPLLFVAADSPLLTAQAVEDFLRRCADRPAALHYPIVRRADCERRFPGVRRTYVRLREGQFTGGNCFHLDPLALEPVLRWLERFYGARKRPWQLARLLGWRFVFLLLTGRASLPGLERHAQRLLGLPARAVITPFAELGVDVDKPADLAVAQRALAAAP